MPLPDDAELSFYFGDTWLWDFDCSEAITGNPAALITGAAWRLAKDGTVVKELTLGAGLTLSAPRTVSLSVAAADAAAFGSAMYAQELRVDFDDGTRLTAAAGTFVIHESLFDEAAFAIPLLDFSLVPDCQYCPLIGV